jgi:hypothetical protein
MKIFSSDDPVANGSADPFSDEIFTIMLRLGRGVHRTESSIQCLVD